MDFPLDYYQRNLRHIDPFNCRREKMDCYYFRISRRKETKVRILVIFILAQTRVELNAQQEFGSRRPRGIIGHIIKASM